MASNAAFAIVDTKNHIAAAGAMVDRSSLPRAAPAENSNHHAPSTRMVDSTWSTRGTTYHGNEVINRRLTSTTAPWSIDEWSNDDDPSQPDDGNRRQGRTSRQRHGWRRRMKKTIAILAAGAPWSVSHQCGTDMMKRKNEEWMNKEQWMDEWMPRHGRFHINKRDDVPSWQWGQQLVVQHHGPRHPMARATDSKQDDGESRSKAVAANGGGTTIRHGRFHISQLIWKERKSGWTTNEKYVECSRFQ
jgi:hypothetical protein